MSTFPSASERATWVQEDAEAAAPVRNGGHPVPVPFNHPDLTAPEADPFEDYE